MLKGIFENVEESILAICFLAKSKTFALKHIRFDEA
jgi:hypothetical protein